MLNFLLSWCVFACSTTIVTTMIHATYITCIRTTSSTRSMTSMITRIPTSHWIFCRIQYIWNISKHDSTKNWQSALCCTLEELTTILEFIFFLIFHSKWNLSCLWTPQIRRKQIVWIRVWIQKKTWEFLLLAHPSLQALALPPPKDKQHSQPTSWHIIQRCLPLCSVTNGYNTPNADVPLPHLLGFVKFARFEDLKITSVNVLFSMKSNCNRL